jgi:hypothetical protein
MLKFHSLPQRRHALLQFLERQFQGRRAGDPDEIGGFFGLGEVAAINLPHAAAELCALRGGADALGREKSNRACLARFHRIARDEIERHEAVADPAPFEARGVKDGAAADDLGAGEGFGTGGTRGRRTALRGKNQGQDGV